MAFPVRIDPRWAAAKSVLFLACLAPAAWLVWGAFNNGLGADPVDRITRETGIWALRLLCATLAMTPLRLISAWAGWIRLRRMVGLFVAFYASLHLATYVMLDLGLYWPNLVEDVLKRPYMTAGFAAWLGLVLLALTSTRGMMRRLGRHWQRLHRGVYAIAALAILHFVWLVKADLREPLVYAAILTFLLAFRIPVIRRHFTRRSAPAKAGPIAQGGHAP